jgi:hypothetical protein
VAEAGRDPPISLEIRKDRDDGQQSSVEDSAPDGTANDRAQRQEAT